MFFLRTVGRGGNRSGTRIKTNGFDSYPHPSPVFGEVLPSFRTENDEKHFGEEHGEEMKTLLEALGKMKADDRVAREREILL